MKRNEVIVMVVIGVIILAAIFLVKVLSPKYSIHKNTCDIEKVPILVYEYDMSSWDPSDFGDFIENLDINFYSSCNDGCYLNEDLATKGIDNKYLSENIYCELDGFCYVDWENCTTEEKTEVRIPDDSAYGDNVRTISNNAPFEKLNDEWLNEYCNALSNKWECPNGYVVERNK